MRNSAWCNRKNQTFFSSFVAHIILYNLQVINYTQPIAQHRFLNFVFTRLIRAWVDEMSNNKIHVPNLIGFPVFLLNIPSLGPKHFQYYAPRL